MSDDTFLPEVSSEGKLQVISQVFAVLRAYNCTKAADSKEDENESHPVKNVDIFYKVSVRALRRGEKAIGFKPRDKRSLAAQGEADKIVPTEDKTGTPSIVDNNGQTWLKDLLARISRKNTKFYAAYAAGFSCAVSEKEDRSTMVFEERIRPALLEFVKLAEKYDADRVIMSDGIAVLAETAEQVCAQLSLERQYIEKKLASSIEDALPTAIAIVNKRYNLFRKNDGGVHLSSWEQGL